MRRRDFLKSPAVTLLVPAAAGLALQDAFAFGDEQKAPTREEAARRHPQRLHQDFSTYQPGIEYFFLGNGDIQAAIQYAPDRSGDLPPTFLGLTLMDAERFSRKWSTYLFHPERGYEGSKLYVMTGNQTYVVTPESLRDVRWKLVDAVPVVSLTWKAGALNVEEEFFVPAEGAYLVRQVRIHNGGPAPASVALRLPLVPNFTVFDDIGTDPASNTAFGRGYTEVTLRCVDGAAKASGRYDVSTTLEPLAQEGSTLARFVYTIRKGTVPLEAKDVAGMWGGTAAYWKSKPVLTTGDERLDRMYMLARSGLKALLARSGKRDGGIWQYNMEWVRDDVMMIQALCMAGMHDEARTLLEKNLSRCIAPDGCLVESSRWSGYDYTELDQNGQLVYGTWQYLCWTGDRELVKKYWPRIVKAGDYPLQEPFRDKRSRLLRNKREFWERDDRFGFEDGFELAYQFWVMLGLEKGSEVARALGDDATARRWQQTAAEFRQILFEDPVFRFIENGRLIKRRTRDGRWQQYAIPPQRASMPAGSPMALNDKPEPDPDSANVYPIIFNYVDPRGDVARKTMEWMDMLWNQQWLCGGYSRYNTTSEPDPPAPWPIASLFIARAAVEMGDDDRAWRAIDWVASIHGGKSGGWFERYGPSITPPAPPVSVVGWGWAEVVLLTTQHIMGFRADLNAITIRPRLIRGLDHLHSTFVIRGATVDVSIRRGTPPSAALNGTPAAVNNGALTFPCPSEGSRMEVVMEVSGR